MRKKPFVYCGKVQKGRVVQSFFFFCPISLQITNKDFSFIKVNRASQFAV